MVHQKGKEWAGIGEEEPCKYRKCSISAAQANSALGQTSVQSCLVGIVGTAGDEPLTASLTLRVTTPRLFPGERALGTAASEQHFMGLLIHCVPGAGPGFPALPPANRLIEYPQGSQSPGARADCRKVIHIKNRCLRRTGRALGRPTRYPHPFSLPLITLIRVIKAAAALWMDFIAGAIGGKYMN